MNSRLDQVEKKLGEIEDTFEIVESKQKKGKQNEETGRQAQRP